MVKTSTQKILKKICITATLCMLFFCNTAVFAQKSDSTIRIRLSGRSAAPLKKVELQTLPAYRAPTNFISYNSVINPGKTTTTKAADKNLTVSKIYPNPVSDQVNIIFKLEKESNLSIKIHDILGNEVVTLSNEKTAAGEQTKNFTLPKRLNTGMYFLRILAGQELIVKRISVL